jgi:hypothetical protein
MTDTTQPKRYRDSKEREIVLSVDLGKMQDFTAYTISEILPESREEKSGATTTLKTVNVRDIQRLPLGTSYHDIADHIYDLFFDERLKLIDPKTLNPIFPTMLVDAGGVGEAVADDLSRRLGLLFIRYRLVRGTSETRKARRNYTVPRTRMFEQLYAAFTDDRIRIEPRLKLAESLLTELRNLRPEANEETGYVKVVHREGEHDDMAICLAGTNWWCNRPKGRPTRLISDEETVNRLMGLVPNSDRPNYA